MDARKLRELEFHNHRFESGNRGFTTSEISGRIDKYYSVVERSRSFYTRLLQNRCAGKRILEYGCGTGSHAFLLAKKGGDVTGIDISDVAVRKASEQAGGLPNLSFRVMDAEELTFAPATFDLICGTAILHHLDLRKAFAELARTLRPSGMAVFLEPLGHNPLINLYRRLTPTLRTADEHPLRMDDLRLAEEYFGKVEAHFFHLFSLLAVPVRSSRSFNRVLQWLDAIDASLFSALPITRRFAWATVLTFSQPRSRLAS
jgi:SAM-dependent methyltransferase